MIRDLPTIILFYFKQVACISTFAPLNDSYLTTDPPLFSGFLGHYAVLPGVHKYLPMFSNNFTLRLSRPVSPN